MIKQSITEYFDNYQLNLIRDVPTCQFKPLRDPFDYLVPQKIYYKDLRENIKLKQFSSNFKQQGFVEKLKRYKKQFQFRKSSQLRVLTHTLQYTALSSLIIFGFYSRQFSGFKRFQHLLKQTAKTGFCSGAFFAINETLYPFIYKLNNELNQKPIFSVGNMTSSLLIFPLIFLFQWNILASLRKSLFICAYGQIRDFQSESQRFYKLNPDSIFTLSKTQTQRIKHPFQDPYKKLGGRKTRAQIERDQQQQQDMKKQTLSQNKGQKIPSTHKYLIMPQIYRMPTDQEKRNYQEKAAAKTQEMLDQKGIEWIKIISPQQKEKQASQKQKNKSSSWWPW